jgi:hypothetical protein
MFFAFFMRSRKKITTKDFTFLTKCLSWFRSMTFRTTNLTRRQKFLNLYHLLHCNICLHIFNFGFIQKRFITERINKNLSRNKLGTAFEAKIAIIRKLMRLFKFFGSEFADKEVFVIRHFDSRLIFQRDYNRLMNKITFEIIVIAHSLLDSNQ